MGFDLDELEPHDTALLALEELRASARWFEQAADSERIGAEVALLLRDAAAAVRDEHERLIERVRERFGDLMPAERVRRDAAKRPAWLVQLPGSDITAEELLEVAISEQEEQYQFFLQQEAEASDPWLRSVLADLATQAKHRVILLEEEREGIVDRDGA